MEMTDMEFNDSEITDMELTYRKKLHKADIWGQLLDERQSFCTVTCHN